MARRKAKGSGARVRALVKSKDMGAWEKRLISTMHPLRPRLARNERWLVDCWVNNRYSVQLSSYDGDDGVAMLHLWIRRHDGAMTNSWADLQRIKNEVVGRDRVAVQVHPPDDELVDSANMAHLWVYPAGHSLPFTLAGRTRAQQKREECSPDDQTWIKTL